MQLVLEISGLFDRQKLTTKVYLECQTKLYFVIFLTDNAIA